MSEPKNPLRTLDELEQQHIDDVLRATLGNRTLAAKLLGIDRSTLIRKLARRRANDCQRRTDA